MNRITMNLSSRTATQLDELVTSTESNKTAVTSRAINLYHTIETRRAAGEQIVFVKDGKTQIVEFL